jgi:hypothetical protein
MAAMRAVPLVLLLLLLTGCVTREAAPPRPTTTATTRAVPTNPVKDNPLIQRDLATVRAWLTNCAPGLPRAPGCDWETVHATARSVIGVIDVAVADSPWPETHWHLTNATREAAGAFRDFEQSCVEWLDTGDAPAVMVKLNCANLWEWLPHTWTALEAAVVQ